MAKVAVVPHELTGVPPNLLRGQIERMPAGQFLWWWVQPHWVPAVMAGSPSRVGGRVRAGGFSPTGFRRSSRVLLPGVHAGLGGGVQPHCVPAVIAVLLPDALHTNGYRGIEIFNSMVTRRYITRITVSRQELRGQVAGEAAAAQNRESVGDDKSRKAPQLSRVVSVRSGVLTAGVLAL